MFKNICIYLCLVLIAGFGCSAESPDSPDKIDASTGSGDDAGVVQSCNFTNCDGCCDGTTCIETPSEAACGQAGSACRSCSGDDICAAGGCVPPTANCDGCDGCCLGGTQCLEGSAPTACGDSGNACTECPSGQGCESGSCVANECNASNCPMGCCDASGECKAYTQQSTGLCGTAGAACTNCPNDALSCTVGTCVIDQPCLSFCDDGCCTAQGQCIPFSDQDPGQCGAASTCTPCGGELNCVTGTCTVDPVWVVTIRNVIIAATDENGSDWDTIVFSSPLPDPYVQSGLNENSVGFPEGETDTIDNTLTPNWTAQTQSTYSHTESSLTTSGLRFKIRDSDGLAYETIGECTTTISLVELMAGTKTVASCGPLNLATNLRVDFALQ